MKFSRMLFSLCTLAVLSGCAYIIPPENNAPRNNTVLGEPRRPELNNGMSRSAGAQRVDATPSGAPSQYVARSNAPVAGDRRPPMENGQFQVAGNDSYPSMMNVPPRPALTGPDSSKERLTTIKSDLEQDRANAQASKDALARDAGAEPSMLSKLPGTVAPNDPIVTQPLPPAGNSDGARKVPVEQPDAFAVPMGSQTRTAIRLVPPSSDGTQTRIASYGRPNVNRGDFDPLAAADNTPIVSSAPIVMTPPTTPTTYASDGYMSASRYAGVRGY